MFKPGNAPSPQRKIALVSSGLSHVQRGFETYTQDLYDALKETGAVTLFKGSGPAQRPGVVTVPTLRRDHPLLRELYPDNEARRYRYEQASMAISGWLLGYWQRFDIIHFCDPIFGNALVRLQRRFNPKYQLLFANCGPALPRDYNQFNHIQEFTPQYFNQAKKAIRKTRLHLNPMGIWTERFQPEKDQARLREEWDIPRDKFVILSVASLDEPYKRLPFLINTVAEMNDPDLFLLLVGQNQNTSQAQKALAMAAGLLPGRHRHLTVPYQRIPEIYRAADLFVLPSLQEGFGKVYLEAMASRIPMLAHFCPNTLWIVRDPDCLLDMEDPEALKSAIGRMRDESGTGLSEFARNVADANHGWVRDRFHWTSLRQEYLDMYDRILTLPV